MDILNYLNQDKELSDADINQYYQSAQYKPKCVFLKNLGGEEHNDKNSIFFVNLGNEGNGGTHWVLLYLKGKSGYYFDSFGITPSREIISNYVRMCGGSSFSYNIEDIQNIKSNLCGYYCIYVCDKLMSGRGYNSIINDFTQDPSNENVEVLRRHFG